MFKIITFILSLLTGLTILTTSCFANVYVPYYINEESGYQVYIVDDANLLTQEEEESLLDEMSKLTAYGDVLLHTTRNNPTSTALYAKELYENCINPNGTVILLDMDHGKMEIYSGGYIYESIPSQYAAEILREQKGKFNNSEYYTCIFNIFETMNNRMDKLQISTPMKVISCLLIAITVGFIITYLIVRILYAPKAVSHEELQQNMFSQTNLSNVKARFINQTFRYYGRDRFTTFK